LSTSPVQLLENIARKERTKFQVSILIVREKRSTFGHIILSKTVSEIEFSTSTNITTWFKINFGFSFAVLGRSTNASARARTHVLLS